MTFHVPYFIKNVLERQTSNITFVWKACFHFHCTDGVFLTSIYTILCWLTSFVFHDVTKKYKRETLQVSFFVKNIIAKNLEGNFYIKAVTLLQFKNTSCLITFDDVYFKLCHYYYTLCQEVKHRSFMWHSMYHNLLRIY